MEIHLCDICKEVINSSKYFIVIAQDIEEEKESLQPNYGTNITGAYETAMRQYSKYKKTMKNYEICDKCKKVLDYLFSLRKKDLEKLKQKSDKIVKKEGLWEL